MEPPVGPSDRNNTPTLVRFAPGSVAAARPSLLPALEGYEDLQLIAHGSTALVFRATQTRLNRLVAIKVVTAETTSVRANAERELATTVALSRQPHIVSIIDTGLTADRRRYIVMEYYEGGSYEQILRDSGPMSVADVLEVGIKIGEALHAAHQAGIVHRDVKPSNILSSRFGPALADFGIARAPDELGGTLTREMMTPQYASPEAIRHETQTAPSDVYSLATTMWTLLAGHSPFVDPNGPSGDPYQVARRVLREPPPPMPRPDVPTWLVAELTRAMSKLPSQRHATALEFAEALRRGALGSMSAAPGRAPRAAPTGGSASVRTGPGRRHPIAWISARTRRRRTPGTRVMRSLPPSAGSRRYLSIAAVAIASVLAVATVYQLTNEHRAGGGEAANVRPERSPWLPTELVGVTPSAIAPSSQSAAPPTLVSRAPTTATPAPTTPAPQPIRIDYVSFADISEMVINGSAAGTGTAVRLTSGTHAAGSAWARTNIDLKRSFTTSFQLSIPGFSDGIAFVIQSQGPAALGWTGGGLGYGGPPQRPTAARIVPSLSIEFDAWDNSRDGWDPADHQHVAVTTNGDVANHLFWADPGLSLVGQPVRAWIEYDADSTMLAIYVSRGAERPVTPLITATIDIAAVVGAGPAYVGFTAGTGQIGGVQEVLSWHLEA